MEAQHAGRERVRIWASRVLLAVGVVAFVVGFDQVASSYEWFLLPQQGVTFVPERELAFAAYFSLCGVGALGCAALCLGSFGDPRWWRSALASLEQRPRLVCAVLALGVFVASALFRRLVLDAQAIADDEATYLFIARTLLEGRLVNPVPEDAEFFRNQFVVLNEHGWYGKYPIGHPLILALGELLHLQDVIVPVVAALCVPLTFAVGRRFVGPRRALLSAALLLVSPQFVGTAGTLLSQPTCCLTMLLGLWLVRRANESEAAGFGSALLAGLAFGCGVLVRPLPGGLFALVALAWSVGVLVRKPRPQRTAAVVRTLLIAAGSATGVIAVLAVNYAQTGDAFSSGYHQVHGSVAVFNNAHADIANSVFGALLRENYWLLGVPACLVPLLFARPASFAPLFWGVLLAELAYRVIAPKTVVASTGPVYLYEVVPLLLIGVVDGLARLRERFSIELRALPLLAAGMLVLWCMFWPVQWRTLRRSAEARGMVFRALEQAGAGRALVFADALVSPNGVYSWAYYPDNPSPDLSDRILFVRIPKPDTSQRAQAFWLRRFADRRAFALTWDHNGEPAIEELSR